MSGAKEYGLCHTDRILPFLFKGNALPLSFMNSGYVLIISTIRLDDKHDGFDLTAKKAGKSSAYHITKETS